MASLGHPFNIIAHLLPVAHPILNPIEAMWGQIKQYVRQRNSEFDMEAIRSLAMEKMSTQRADVWQRSIEDTRKYPVEQWLVDEDLLNEAESGPDAEDKEDHNPISD